MFYGRAEKFAGIVRFVIEKKKKKERSFSVGANSGIPETPHPRLQMRIHGNR